ncbi:hypothetical protein [Winogradskyella sp. SYSU M77433]|uniref:hypothetical protein n=1 Tax=Winogradskyella sp. SYSU M77433 TaxID=3042722 RepID=UPI0024804568|nr:hypothetical protein [Winogradskyella sp. SYSU M77433]MDH7911343.1 hypothetical protein [Winogradskyella sp. SYSU M77433]
MARLEKFQLEYIKGNAFGDKNIHQLMKEKKDALDDLKKERPTSYNKPSPKLTPENDITIDKTFKSKGLDNETYIQKYETINKGYNDKIFQSTKNHFEESNPPEDLQLLDELGREDLALLLEKDSDAVLDKWKEQELQETKDHKLDITMDDKKSREVFGTLESEKDIVEIDKKDFKQQKNIEQFVHMDEEKNKKVFNRRSVKDDFKDNEKDITVGRSRTSSPSDDFE